ncbi:MAG: hypothetical protein LBU68_01930 [Rickettsiales bacterium]|jgi:type II secretory pathway component GspD/PulD (secretin)|nr:hypothetical protein [Rickettsiales bacterium]
MTNKLIKAASKILITSIMMLSLVACEGQREVAEMTDMDIKSKLDSAEQHLEASKKPSETVSVDTVSISDDLYLGDSSILLDYLNPLPRDFETEYGITLTSRAKVGIFELANQIYYLSGIQTKVLDVPESVKAKKINISYSGPLSGLLNMMSNELNVSWEYTGNTINLFSTRTKTFSIYTIPVSTKMSARVKGDAKGETTISAEADLENWMDIENTLKNIIAGDASASINISKPTSTVTITASVEKLKKIEDFIKSVNQRLSRQVSIHVKIVQVSLNDRDQMGLDLKGLFTSSGIKLATGAAATSTPGDLGITILEDASGAFGSLAGTDAAIKALSEQYRVSYVTDTTLLTRNGRVFPFNMLREFKYVKSMASTTESESMTTDIQTDDLSTGLSIQVLPNILDNGRLMLMFSMSLRELLEMKEGPQGIQLPDIDNRTFMNELILQSGQTVVLTGFEKVTNSNRDQGIGDPNFKALGGSGETDSKKEVLVVILTPQILKSPLHADRRAGVNTGYSDAAN